MRHGIVLFTCDRGITPAQAAKAAEDRGFDTFYVPEHTHIPARRAAPHPGTGGAALPDDRYLRTLDPWVSLATAADIAAWAGAGATECLWGVPDGPAAAAEAYLDRLADRVPAWR
jgi:hypothetical protein